VRRVPAVLLFASAVTLGACQQKSTNEATANDQMAAEQNLATEDTTNGMTSAGATAIDTAFLTDAMKGDNGEVAIGNLAAEKASSSAAKDFGRLLATDHGSHKQKLAALASSAGLPTTDESTDEAKANLDKLKGLSGAAFDKEFAKMMVEDHQKDIAKYEKQASSGDPQTAALAKETLPVLRKHLKTAQGL
jgi:putative membrane protein